MDPQWKKQFMGTQHILVVWTLFLLEVRFNYWPSHLETVFHKTKRASHLSVSKRTTKDSVTGLASEFYFANETLIWPLLSVFVSSFAPSQLSKVWPKRLKGKKVQTNLIRRWRVTFCLQRQLQWPKKVTPNTRWRLHVPFCPALVWEPFCVQPK